MTLLKEPAARSGDNLDNLLRAFFQAELPHAWPVMEVPSLAVRPAPERDEPSSRPSQGSLVRSRLALAASIALLVSGPLCLTSALRETEPSGTILMGPSTAQKDNLHAPRYRSTESLLVTPDGVSIRVDISEMPAAK